MDGLQKAGQKTYFGVLIFMVIEEAHDGMRDYYAWGRLYRQRSERSMRIDFSKLLRLISRGLIPAHDHDYVESSLLVSLAKVLGITMFSKNGPLWLCAWSFNAGVCREKKQTKPSTTVRYK
jgi:hypothetical protein